MASFSVRMIARATTPTLILHLSRRHVVFSVYSTPTLKHCVRDSEDSCGKRIQIIKLWNFDAKLIPQMAEANNNLPFAEETHCR